MKSIRITTPREFLEHRHELGLYCRACDRWTVADLQLLIDRALGDRPIQRLRFVCNQCGGKMDKQVRPPATPRS